MGRGSGAFKLILIILVFYLLVHGSYAQNSEINATITGTINVTGIINGTTDNTADNRADTEKDSESNYIEKFEWILLLPIIYGNLLFLSWVSRFFDKMNFCFVIFVLTALLVLIIFIIFCPNVFLLGTNNSYDIMSCSKTFLPGASDSSNISSCTERSPSGADNYYSFIFFYLYLLIFIIVSLIIIAVLYNAFFKRDEEGYSLVVDKDKVTIYKDYAIVNTDGLKIDEKKVKKDEGKKDEEENTDKYIVKVDKDKVRINKSRVLIDENELVVNLHDIIRNFLIIFMGLMWPTILLYFHIRRIDYVTFYGIENLAFPVYIIVASSIGILSYLYLSIEDVFCQLIPEYKKISIAWSYLRRITIAPFIALIGFYILKYMRNMEEITTLDDYSIFIFSFFAGVFTKTIEEWIYTWVQKLLPGDKKGEFEARTEYQIKESELVKKLRFDEDVAYALYNVKVRSIEELAASDPKKLKSKLDFDPRNLGEHMGLLLTEQEERFDSYSEQQIKMYIDRARTYMSIDKSEFVTKLDMDMDLAFKLYYFASVKTLEDLKNCNPKGVFEKICFFKKEAEELAKRINIDVREAYKNLCGYSEEDIKKFKIKADCICYFASIKTFEDLKNCDPAEVCERIYNCKKEAEELAERMNIDVEEIYKNLYKCSGNTAVNNIELQNKEEGRLDKEK